MVGYCLPLKDKLPPVSWASARWQNEAGNALENLVKTVGKSAWREHCLGIQIAAGTDGEWRFPHAENLPDVGNALTDAFRTFALSKYRRNPGLLKIAWDNPRAEFDRITCPNAADRRLADYGVFRDPKRSRRTLDYYECLAMVQNDAALHFCRCVKRASEGQMLVGLSYSPLFGQEALPEDAHAFPQAVLESPDVDFFANVGTAGANSCLRAMNGSIALQQKFLFHVTVPDTPLERLSTLAKNYPMGMIVPNETPENTLRSLVPLFDRPNEKETVTQERIAVFVDPANLAVVASAESRLNELLLSAQLRELAHLDTPFDLYLVSDLFHAKLPKFKVALFLNVFYLSEAERRRIDGRIKQNNQIALWLFAPGLVNEEGISAEAALQVCGQKLRLERTTTSLKLRVVEVNDPITLGFHIATPMGADVPISPTLTITDKTSTRLGANSANKTAFAVRRYGHWTSVVFGTAPVPARLLQGVLRSLKPLAP